MKVQVIITVSVVIFAKGFRLKFVRKIEKRPRTHFLTKWAILQNQKLKFNETSKNEFLRMETIYQKTLCQKKERKIAEKVKYLNFYPHRWPFWNPSFFEGGTVVFKLFFNFFFENGIRKYKVTNLSGDHDDLKLWPSIAHFYYQTIRSNVRD